MQFVCFRNYGCPIDLLLEVSPWDSKPQELKKFMDTIDAKYGNGCNEAVELGLAHAVSEAEKGKLH
jgi:hypothetical protein